MLVIGLELTPEPMEVAVDLMAQQDLARHLLDATYGAAPKTYEAKIAQAATDVLNLMVVSEDGEEEWAFYRRPTTVGGEPDKVLLTEVTAISEAFIYSRWLRAHRSGRAAPETTNAAA